MTDSQSYSTARSQLLKGQVMTASSAKELMALHRQLGSPYYEKSLINSPNSMEYRALQTALTMEYFFQASMQLFQQINFIRQQKLAKLLGAIQAGHHDVAPSASVNERYQDLQNQLSRVDQRIHTFSNTLERSFADLASSIQTYNRNVSDCLTKMSELKPAADQTFLNVLGSFDPSRLNAPFNRPGTPEPQPIRVGSRDYEPGDEQVLKVSKALQSMTAPLMDAVQQSQKNTPTLIQVQTQLEKSLSATTVNQQANIPGFKPVPKPNGGVIFLDIRDLQQLASVSPMLREVKLQAAIMELLMQGRLANLNNPTIQAQEMARLEAHRESFIAMKLLRLHHPELTNALRNERDSHLTVLHSQLGPVNQSLQTVLMQYHRFEKHHVALQGLKQTVDTVHHKAQMLEVIMNDKIGQQHVAEVAPGCQQIIRS